MSGNDQRTTQQATSIPPNVTEEDRWTSTFSGMPVDRGPRLLGTSGSKPLPPTPPSRDGRPPLSTGSKPLPPTPPSRDGRPPLSTGPKPLPPTPPSRDGRPPLSTGPKPLPPTPPSREGRPPLSTEPQVTTPPTVEPERTEFLDKLAKLGETLGKIDERVKKLTAPATEVTKAVKAATDARSTAEKAGEAKPADWPAANASLDELQKKLDAVNTVCLDEAGKLSDGYGKRFEAKKDARPAGRDSVKLRTAYLAQQKKLTGLIGAKDGLGALEACPAADKALTDFDAKAAPSAAVRRQMVTKAIADVRGMSDEAIAGMSLTAKAEMAFNLCANGQPSSGPALTELCRIYKQAEQHRAFLDARDEQRTKIAEKVAKIADLDKLFDDNGDVKPSEWSKVIADPTKVQALLKQVSDAQCEILGLPPLSISTYNTPGDSSGVDMGGCVWHATGLPTIELNAHRDAVSSANEALISILHETFHAQQDILVKKLMAGELGPDDPLYPQVLMFAANKPGNGYLPPSVDQDEYEAQPVEIDAEKQGTEAANAVMLAIQANKKSRKG